MNSASTEKCSLCPRECHVDRRTHFGYCQTSKRAPVAKVMLHGWEEPPISGSRGSGAVFFCGCNLRCIYCQNEPISRRRSGKGMDAGQLGKVFLSLQSEGAHNINLVTPMHLTDILIDAVALAKNDGLQIPIAYNTNAYEKASTLRRMENIVDIWLPDLKYISPQLSERYSCAGDYFAFASQAILEMIRQQPLFITDAEGIARKGVLIRHLVLPGQSKEAKAVIRWAAAHAPGSAISIMRQYTPQKACPEHPELNRRVFSAEYDSVLACFRESGHAIGFSQDKGSADSYYIPDL